MLYFLRAQETLGPLTTSLALVLKSTFQDHLGYEPRDSLRLKTGESSVLMTVAPKLCSVVMHPLKVKDVAAYRLLQRCLVVLCLL